MFLYQVLLFNGWYQSRVKFQLLKMFSLTKTKNMIKFPMNLTTLKFKNKYIIWNFILKVGDIWILDMKDMEVILWYRKLPSCTIIMLQQSIASFNVT